MAKHTITLEIDVEPSVSQTGKERLSGARLPAVVIDGQPHRLYTGQNGSFSLYPIERPPGHVKHYTGNMQPSRAEPAPRPAPGRSSRPEKAPLALADTVRALAEGQMRLVQALGAIQARLDVLPAPQAKRKRKLPIVEATPSVTAVKP